MVRKRGRSVKKTPVSKKTRQKKPRINSKKKNFGNVIKFLLDIQKDHALRVRLFFALLSTNEYVPLWVTLAVLGAEDFHASKNL